MYGFLDSSKPQNLNQEINNLNRLIINKEIEIPIKSWEEGDEEKGG